ncbi:AAA family ATPase [Winogradskyella sp. PE311]|uniref:AAA family ATPase n=1 Tax=Winogradskyella sp. PE311 TaxID=3366943 RepID=UPI00397F6AC5
MNPIRIVITGGPATGKTAIIDNLNSKGYKCYEEVIRKLTAEAQNSGDITETHSNPIALVNDSVLFNTTLINLRVADFKASEKLDNLVSFFDRGMPDVLAYMDYFNQEVGKDFIDICKTYRYDFVFLLPPWKAIYKDDAERFETFDQATDIYHKLMQTYQRFDYKIIEVPFGKIEDRTQFIIEKLNL